MRKLVVVMMAAVLVGACGGGKKTSQPKASLPSLPANMTLPTAPNVEKPKMTAEQVVNGLKAKGLPIGQVVVHTPSDDPNHQLGQPGQYVSQAVFADTRLAQPAAGTELSVDNGGEVETFPEVGEVNSRLSSLNGIAQKFGLAVEHDFVAGTALLRVSKNLSNDQAAQYETALKAVMGV